jgi:hypothetical protein
LRGGFKDGKGNYLTDREWLDVWLSDQPLGYNEGLPLDAEVVFEVELDLPQGAISDYEWVEEGKPYREWLMPAALVNRHATLREMGAEDTSATES